MLMDIEDHIPSDAEARDGEADGDAPDDTEGEDSDASDWMTALEKALERKVGDKVLSDEPEDVHDDPPGPVPEETPIRDDGDDLAEDEISEDCLTNGKTWGVFRLTAKTSNAWSPPVGWQVRCPFHQKNILTGCKRVFPYEGTTDNHRRRSLKRALWWCLLHQDHDRQRSHLTCVIDDADIPHSDIILAQVITDKPVGVFDDDELDRLQIEGEVEPEAVPVDGEIGADRGRARGRGRGRGGRRGRGRAGKS